jgi:hypothetical protein
MQQLEARMRRMDALMQRMISHMGQDMLQAIQGLRPCQSPPDTGRRLDPIEEGVRAVQEGLQELNETGAAAAPTEGSVHPQNR